MRKFWLVPCLALFVGGVASAQEEKSAAPADPAAPAAKPAKPTPAKITAESATLDIGQVNAAETKDYTIKLKNEGEAEAKNVACRGLGFKFDPKKQNIAGGATADVKATYTAPKRAGKAEKPIKVKITCQKAKVAATGTLMPKAPATPPTTPPAGGTEGGAPPPAK